MEDVFAKAFEINTLDSSTWEVDSNTAKAAQIASFWPEESKSKLSKWLIMEPETTTSESLGDAPRT